jgi:hypothetical protein
METISCSAPSSSTGSGPEPCAESARLERTAARFAPVDLGADVAELPDTERKALSKLVSVARTMDALFLRQAWAGNKSTLLENQSAMDLARLDHCEAFVPGALQRPDAANCYPDGASRAGVEAWVETLHPAERVMERLQGLPVDIATGFVSGAGLQ